MTVDLVTGGAGFIGSHLVRRLLSEGRQVRVIDDLSTGSRARLDGLIAPADFTEGDLASADLRDVIRGVERVFHLAAVPSVPRSVRDPLRSHEAAATATLRLLIACREAQVRRFVLSSSSSVYGDSTVSPKHEALPMVPVSPYAVAKGAAEGYARVFSSLYGLHTVSLRYFNVFGPGQDPTSAYAAVIPRFITLALAGEPLPVNGDGTQTRDFTYVDNVVDANLLAASADVPGGRAFNIAAGDPRSVNELVAALGRILGRKLVQQHAPRRVGDILHSHADVRAAAAELGWRPHIGFEEGLRRTVDSLRGA